MPGVPGETLIETDLWRQVIIDTAVCTGCRMCASFCPTGSLFKFHTKKGHMGVKQRPRDCVACGTCRDVCTAHALSLSAEVFADDIASGAVERFLLGDLQPEPSFSFHMGV